MRLYLDFKTPLIGKDERSTVEMDEGERERYPENGTYKNQTVKTLKTLLEAAEMCWFAGHLSCKLV